MASFERLQAISRKQIFFIVVDHVNHFDDEALAAFEAAAGPLLRELGYE